MNSRFDPFDELFRRLSYSADFTSGRSEGDALVGRWQAQARSPYRPDTWSSAQCWGFALLLGVCGAGVVVAYHTFDPVAMLLVIGTLSLAALWAAARAEVQAGTRCPVRPVRRLMSWELTPNPWAPQHRFASLFDASSAWGLDTSAWQRFTIADAPRRRRKDPVSAWARKLRPSMATALARKMIVRAFRQGADASLQAAQLTWRAAAQTLRSSKALAGAAQLSVQVALFSTARATRATARSLWASACEAWSAEPHLSPAIQPVTIYLA